MSISSLLRSNGYVLYCKELICDDVEQTTKNIYDTPLTNLPLGYGQVQDGNFYRLVHFLQDNGGEEVNNLCSSYTRFNFTCQTPTHTILVTGDDLTDMEVQIVGTSVPEIVFNANAGDTNGTYAKNIDEIYQDGTITLAHNNFGVDTEGADLKIKKVIAFQSGLITLLCGASFNDPDVVTSIKQANKVIVSSSPFLVINAGWNTSGTLLRDFPIAKVDTGENPIGIFVKDDEGGSSIVSNREWVLSKGLCCTYSGFNPIAKGSLSVQPQSGTTGDGGTTGDPSIGRVQNMLDFLEKNIGYSLDAVLSTDNYVRTMLDL